MNKQTQSAKPKTNSERIEETKKRNDKGKGETVVEAYPGPVKSKSVK